MILLQSENVFSKSVITHPGRIPGGLLFRFFFRDKLKLNSVSSFDHDVHVKRQLGRLCCPLDSRSLSVSVLEFLSFYSTKKQPRNGIDPTRSIRVFNFTPSGPGWMAQAFPRLSVRARLFPG